jgi:hypothetical protein
MHPANKDTDGGIGGDPLSQGQDGEGEDPGPTQDQAKADRHRYDPDRIPGPDQGLDVAGALEPDLAGIEGLRKSHPNHDQGKPTGFIIVDKVACHGRKPERDREGEHEAKDHARPNYPAGIPGPRRQVAPHHPVKSKHDRLLRQGRQADRRPVASVMVGSQMAGDEYPHHHPAGGLQAALQYEPEYVLGRP